MHQWNGQECSVGAHKQCDGEDNTWSGTFTAGEEEDWIASSRWVASEDILGPGALKLIKATDVLSDVAACIWLLHEVQLVPMCSHHNTSVTILSLVKPQIIHDHYNLVAAVGFLWYCLQCTVAYIRNGFVHVEPTGGLLCCCTEQQAAASHEKRQQGERVRVGRGSPKCWYYLHHADSKLLRIFNFGHSAWV